jgi:hypothetical protein
VIEAQHWRCGAALSPRIVELRSINRPLQREAHPAT